MTILPKKKTAKEKAESEKAVEHSVHSHGHVHGLGHNHVHGLGLAHSHFHIPSGVESRHDKAARVRVSAASREDSIDNRGTFDGHESGAKHKRRHRSSPHRSVRKHRGHNAVSQPHGINSNADTSSECEDYNSGYNSEDEHRAIPEHENAELECWFEETLRNEKGMTIKKMGEDGACLFRAVADQVYGDQEMHQQVRQQCMDYIAKNQDHFQPYLTEDIKSYLSRKQLDTCHGNHIEVQAMCELYNRPIEVYQYSLEPINTFSCGLYRTDNEPIRLSYHRNAHYNSVVNPYKATVGVGLGLPGFKPGLAEENLMVDAMSQSENVHIEQAMLKDKMKETDWERTQEDLDEQVARESYLYWLRDQEKMTQRQDQRRSVSATCSISPEACSSSKDLAGSPDGTRGRSPRSRNSPAASGQNSPQMSELGAHSADLSLSQTSGPLSAVPGCSKSSPAGMLQTTTDVSSTSLVEEYGFPETSSIMNNYSSNLLGFAPWEEDQLLARVLAQSEEEYYESLKKNVSMEVDNSGSADKGTAGGMGS